MSTEILPFTFPVTGQSVRTVDIDGQPWFVASDVTEILGYSNGRDALNLVDAEDRFSYRRSEAVAGGYPFDDLRIQSVNLVNESGLYALILRSSLAGARAFKRWVTREVLPEIRRAGSYSAARPMDELEMAERQVQLVKEKRAALERAEVAEQHIAELEPAAQAWDTLSNATGDYSLREAAQILSRDPGVATIGQNGLLKYLRERRWVDSGSTPYQDQVRLGRLVQRTDTYDHPHTKEPHLYTQVRITPKGLAELRSRLRIAAQPTLTGASR